MKFILIVAALFVSIPSFAIELYLAEPVLCHGRVIEKPDGMHDSYTQILMRLTSAKSVRRDGTLANTLIVESVYFRSDESVDTDTEEFAEGWYTGPLYKNSTRVSRRSLSGRDDNLELEIIESSEESQDTLQGTYKLVGTVVGDYAYQLRCKAVVVETVSTIIDETSQD